MHRTRLSILLCAALLPLLGLTGQASAEEEASAELRPIVLEIDAWSCPATPKRDPLLPPGQERSVHSVEYLDAGEAEVRRTWLERAPDTTPFCEPVVLHAPPGQSTSASFLEAYHYVKEYRVESSTGAVVADPVIAHVDVGLVLEITPTPSADGAHVTLEIEQTIFALQRPVPTRTLHIDGIDGPLMVELPVVHESHSRTTLRIPREPGGALWLSGYAHPRDEDRDVALLLRTRAATSPAPSPERPERLVSIEARVLAIETSALARVLDTDGTSTDTTARLLDARGVLALLGRHRTGAEGVRILSAPSLVTRPGEAATVNILGQTTYVKDFDVVIGGGGEVAVTPIMETIQDGLVLDLTSRVDGPRGRIVLAGRATWAVLTRPIAEFSAEIQPGHVVTIQIPELRVCRVRIDAEIPPGGYLLSDRLARAEEEDVYLLLRATTLVTPR